MRRIAWIDEDIPVMMPVIQPLQRNGFVFDFYETIANAEAHIAAVKSADILLLDVIVPPGRIPVPGEDHYTGVRFLRHLTAIGAAPPTIVFTVVNATAVLDELRKLNVAHILRKPVRPSVLRTAVEEVLAHLAVA